MSRLSLNEIFEHYGFSPSKNLGLDTWYCCPLHGEKTASLSVNNDEGKWYCFGCKNGGGRVEFVSKLNNVSYDESRKILAMLDGEEIPELDDDRKLLSDIIDYMRIDSGVNPGAIYLEGRGITLETAVKFGVCYCDDYGVLLKVFGISADKAESLGLYDFSKSIVYPAYDFLGPYKVHSRKISEKAYTQAQGKFHKFGLWGIETIKSKTLDIFEGFHDAMTARQNGFPGVAMCGTNFHPEFWEEIQQRGIETVYVCTDGDTAGRECLEKVLANYPVDLDVRFVHLEAGDPDDAINNGTYHRLRDQSEFPLQWYVSKRCKIKTQSMVEIASTYKKISPHYQRLPRHLQSMFSEWFEKEYQTEATGYLYHTAEPNLKYERIVLGNALYSDSVRFETVQRLSETDFHSKLHKNIFMRIKEGDVSAVMINADMGVDLSNEVDLMNSNRYIETVYDIGLRERLDDIILRFRTTLKNTSDVGEMVEKIYTATDSESKVHSGGDVVRRVIRKIGEKVENPDVTGIPISSGFPTVNKSLLGWMPNKLILLAGPTGHGKTTVACNWMDDLMFTQNENVLFASLEMTPEEIVEKQLAINTKIAAYKIQTGSLDQAEYDRLVEASRKILDDKLKIIYGVYDLYKLISIIKSQVLRRKVRWVVIDYVQLIQLNTGRKSERWQDLMEITKALKTQLCSMGITLVAISQLGKQALNSDVPEVADVSGSFGMLADADVGIAVKKIPPDKIKNGSNFIMHIDKHRYGVDNVLVECVFNRATQEIKEVGA